MLPGEPIPIPAMSCLVEPIALFTASASVVDDGGGRVVFDVVLELFVDLTRLVDDGSHHVRAAQIDADRRARHQRCGSGCGDGGAVGALGGGGGAMPGGASTAFARSFQSAYVTWIADGSPCTEMLHARGRNVTLSYVHSIEPGICELATAAERNAPTVVPDASVRSASGSSRVSGAPM